MGEKSPSGDSNAGLPGSLSSSVCWTQILFFHYPTLSLRTCSYHEQTREKNVHTIHWPLLALLIVVHIQFLRRQAANCFARYPGTAENRSKDDSCILQWHFGEISKTVLCVSMTPRSSKLKDSNRHSPTPR